MIDSDRTFAVASDASLVDLIQRAQRRLVVVCPALTDLVANALADRLTDEGSLGVKVILDADPEVYRLGYGTEGALDRLREAAERNLFDLRVQHGVRIGVVISDELTMVFSPVPLLIEAGSTSIEKPNAIILSGASGDRLAEAAGAGPADEAERQEIGTRPLTPAAAQALKQDLKGNPPQPFDVARALRVFSSKVQYAEFEVENYRFSSRQVALPPELLGIADDSLRNRISGRVRAPEGVLGPFEISVETANGKSEKIKADEKWFSSERKRIEDAYTFVVPRFGRVLLSVDRQTFEAEIARFRKNLAKYHQAARAGLENIETHFESSLVKEYLPKWQQHPPASFAKYGLASTDENLEKELRSVIEKLIRKAISFEPPRVRVVYKNIAPESVRNPEFLEPLHKIMRRRGVPVAVIESLFASGDAAPAKGGFTPPL